MIRVDLLLVKKKLVESRHQAQQCIQAEQVEVETPTGWRKINKASELYPETVNLRVSADKNPFVSRGGLKLLNVLDKLNLSVQNKLVLDLGLSTGGFADCVLQKGAKEVTGLDVGSEQLHSRLRTHSQLHWFDGVNVRYLTSEFFKQNNLPEHYDLILADLAFISLTHIFPILLNFLTQEGDILLLVKPQFELSRGDLNKNGIVTDPKLWEQVREKIQRLAADNHIACVHYLKSELLGQDGNQEFFFHGRREV